MKNEHCPGRNLGATRGEFDQRRNVANADVGRLAGGPRDRVGRTFRRFDRHVEPEFAKISALECVVESRRAAVGGKIQHHADLRETLCLGSDWHRMEQRKCPEREGRSYDRLHEMLPSPKAMGAPRPARLSRPNTPVRTGGVWRQVMQGACLNGRANGCLRCGALTGSRWRGRQQITSPARAVPPRHRFGRSSRGPWRRSPRPSFLR